MGTFRRDMAVHQRAQRKLSTLYTEGSEDTHLSLDLIKFIVFTPSLRTFLRETFPC